MRLPRIAIVVIGLLACMALLSGTTSASSTTLTQAQSVATTVSAPYDNIHRDFSTDPSEPTYATNCFYSNNWHPCAAAMYGNFYTYNTASGGMVAQRNGSVATTFDRNKSFSMYCDDNGAGCSEYTYGGGPIYLHIVMHGVPQSLLAVSAARHKV